MQLNELLRSAAQWEMGHRNGEVACATLGTLVICGSQFHGVQPIPSGQATCNGDLAHGIFEARAPSSPTLKQ